MNKKHKRYNHEIDLSRWTSSLNCFAKWMANQDICVAKAWERRLNSKETGAVEGAVAEAVMWDFLACRCDGCRLVEQTGIGGVDFEFNVSGQAFLVEVTNISIDSATRASGISDTGMTNGFHGLLTDRIRTKVRSKFTQARRQHTQPTLIAVTTLHANASSACIDHLAVEFAMGSPPCISARLNPETGDTEGDIYQSTDLSRSVFLSPTPILNDDGLPIAVGKFQPISGFLLGGFGLEPKHVKVYGGLNPVATVPFDSSLLPDIPFCSFESWPISTEMGFKWTITAKQQEQTLQRESERRIRAAGHGPLLDQLNRAFERRSRRHLD